MAKKIPIWGDKILRTPVWEVSTLATRLHIAAHCRTKAELVFARRALIGPKTALLIS